MQVHILSRYKSDFTNTLKSVLGRTTFETSSIEISDPDEFYGITSETRASENTDEDEFCLGMIDITKSVENSAEDEFHLRNSMTILTENVENSDSDEFRFEVVTNTTFTVELSDSDEFSMSGKIIPYAGEDFDDFLLI